MVFIHVLQLPLCLIFKRGENVLKSCLYGGCLREREKERGRGILPNEKHMRLLTF